MKWVVQNHFQNSIQLPLGDDRVREDQTGLFRGDTSSTVWSLHTKLLTCIKITTLHT